MKQSTFVTIVFAVVLSLSIGKVSIAKTDIIQPSLGREALSIQKPTTTIPPALRTQDKGGFSVAPIQRFKDIQKQIDDAKAAEAQAIADAQAQQEAQSARDITPVVETPTIVATPVASASCGDNQYANFIYMHESGCDTGSVNALGCRGIGQACPGDKMPCGADYGCQNAYFTSYCMERYGSWIAAYNFWIANNYW